MYLTERSLPNQRINFITIQEFFTIFNDIIVVVIVIAIVVDFPLLFVGRILTLRLLRPSLLFRIIHLKQNKKKKRLQVYCESKITNENKYAAQQGRGQAVAIPSPCPHMPHKAMQNGFKCVHLMAFIYLVNMFVGFD